MPPEGAASLDDGARRMRLNTGPWALMGLMWQERRVIAAVTAFSLVASIAIALLLPRYYAGEARVLRAEGGELGGMLGLVERAAGGGLGRLLGGGGSRDYTRYLAILNSRSLHERLIEEFDLVTVYGLEQKQYPLERALKQLGDNLAFQVDLEYDYLSVITYDRDPVRAAAMANYLVEELNRTNVALTSDNARRTRTFVEQRLREAEADLDSIRIVMQAFQERHGVIQLEAQAQAFMGSMADAQAQITELEVRYQTLLNQYGPENAQVLAARAALRAARAQVGSIMGGREAVLPVSMQRLPAVAREYAELMQGQLIQAEIIETVYPLYEQARFQERSEARAVQVLDTAVVPTRPARPSRRLIVLVVTLTGLLAASLFVLARAWLRHHHAAVADSFAVGRRSAAGPRPT